MLSGETPVLPGVPRPSRYDSNLFMVWSKRDELKPKLRVGSSAGNDCMKKSFYNEVYFDFFFFFFENDWKGYVSDLRDLSISKQRNKFDQLQNQVIAFS